MMLIAEVIADDRHFSCSHKVIENKKPFSSAKLGAHLVEDDYI
jgi:hypothetical protein